MTLAEFREAQKRLEEIVLRMWGCREQAYANDPALQAEYQKDHNEFIEELSIGGEKYDPNAGDAD